MDKHSKLKIGFIWQGFKGVYGHWNDGLRAAMKLVEKEHEVHYFDTDDDWSGMDVLLYWESLSTAAGKDRDNFFRVQLSPQPKILLFAGGPIEEKWCEGFDLFMVESKINEEEFEKIGKPWMRGFGVDTNLMKPEQQPKIFDGCFPSTCAGWKRQGLFAKALHENGVICGRWQETDPIGFLEARKNRTLVLPELPYEAVNALYNASWCAVNTSSYWGGGQRVTLESMAAGVPVIVMSDSPKNREYVEESGFGLVCEPNEADIRKAVEQIKSSPPDPLIGVNYIKSKWSEKHYAQAILNGITKVLK